MMMLSDEDVELELERILRESLSDCEDSEGSDTHSCQNGWDSNVQASGKARSPSSIERSHEEDELDGASVLAAAFRGEDSFFDVLSRDADRLCSRVFTTFEEIEIDSQWNIQDATRKRSLLRTAAELYDFTQEESEAYSMFLFAEDETGNKFHSAHDLTLNENTLENNAENTTREDEPKRQLSVEGTCVAPTHIQSVAEENADYHRSSFQYCSNPVEAQGGDSTKSHQSLSGAVSADILDTASANILDVAKLDLDAAILSVPEANEENAMSSAHVRELALRQKEVENESLRWERERQSEAGQRNATIAAICEEVLERERMFHEQSQMMVCDLESREHSNYLQDRLRTDRTCMTREDRLASVFRDKEKDIEKKHERQRIDREMDAMVREDYLARLQIDEGVRIREIALMEADEWNWSAPANRCWREHECHAREDSLAYRFRDWWIQNIRELPHMSLEDYNVKKGGDAFADTNYWTRSDRICVNMQCREGLKSLKRTFQREESNASPNSSVCEACYAPSCSSRSTLEGDQHSLEPLCSSLLRRVFTRRFYLQTHSVLDVYSGHDKKLTRNTLHSAEIKRKCPADIASHERSLANDASVSQRPEVSDCRCRSSVLRAPEKCPVLRVGCESEHVERRLKKYAVQVQVTLVAIRDIQDLSLHEYQHLLVLDIADNALSGNELGRTLSAACPLLEQLLMARNSVTSLMGLEHLKNLDVLDAGHNRLNDVDFLGCGLDRIRLLDLRSYYL